MVSMLLPSEAVTSTGHAQHGVSTAVEQSHTGSCSRSMQPSAAVLVSTSTSTLLLVVLVVLVLVLPKCTTSAPSTYYWCCYGDLYYVH